ncbi:hypothetical protein GDO81_011774 [Engystomops pustulosus]|uniref:Secreted protein n=1 Tax=Engystomops pustulosus TaxID=76066 RepID=A0AAV7BH54_ENGPU|nr:hypothetical protein GDO81_011774 [Engystomops pustulosus]
MCLAATYLSLSFFTWRVYAVILEGGSCHNNRADVSLFLATFWGAAVNLHPFFGLRLLPFKFCHSISYLQIPGVLFKKVAQQSNILA